MFDRDSSLIWENYEFGILLKESPENRFARYKITDPYLKNFISRYESLVPWGNIKSTDDINNFISSTLLPKLTSKTKLGDDFDPNNTLYTTKINWGREVNALRLAAENGDNNAIMSLRTFEKDPESAKRKIISDINNSKKRIFASWENYILRDNEIYKKSPAFQFLLLSSIYKSTDNTKTSGLLPLNQAVVANVYDNIKKIYENKDDDKTKINPNFNILDYYKQTSIEYAGKAHGSFESGDGKWIKIPSEDNDPDNFEKNVELLMSLAAGTNWCIAGEGSASGYLAEGDFYIFFRNIDNTQRGVAAIRMQGDQITEIRGTEAGQEINDMYIQNVLDLIEEEKLEGGKEFVLNIRSKKHRKALKEKIKSRAPFTEEDAQKMTDAMGIFSYHHVKLKCIKIGNEYKVTVINQTYNRNKIDSEPISTWLDEGHLDLLNGKLYNYFYIFSEDYDPFEGFDISHYNPSTQEISYILHEIDDKHMNKIFELAISQGWDVDKESFRYSNANKLKNDLSKWIDDNLDTDISNIIINAYGRGMIYAEFNERKQSIVDYLDQNLSQFIAKHPNMDWFESHYSLELNLGDAIQILHLYEPEHSYDFYVLVKEHFNVTNYRDNVQFHCDDKHAANYIIENLPS